MRTAVELVFNFWKAFSLNFSYKKVEVHCQSTASIKGHFWINFIPLYSLLILLENNYKTKGFLIINCLNKWLREKTHLFRTLKMWIFIDNIAGIITFDIIRKCRDGRKHIRIVNCFCARFLKKNSFTNLMRWEEVIFKTSCHVVKIII